MAKNAKKPRNYAGRRHNPTPKQCGISSRQMLEETVNALGKRALCELFLIFCGGCRLRVKQGSGI